MPALVWIFLLLIVVQTWISTRLFARLETAHREAWIALGCPSLFTGTIADKTRLLTFVFVSSRYKYLNDPTVTALIWILRVLGGLVAIILFAGYWRGDLPYHSVSRP